jgi:hypothetical protein
VPSKRTFQTGAKQVITVDFALNVVDGWPPVAVESVKAEPIKQGFKICSAPLFIKNMSVGDIVRATEECDGRVYEWVHLEQSGHSNIWIGRLNRDATRAIHAALNQLLNIGCAITHSDQLGCYAVDVPPILRIEPVDEILAQLDREEVAVVYPSMRHEETPAS